MDGSLRALREKEGALSDSVAGKRLALFFDDGRYDELERFALGTCGAGEVVCAYGRCGGSPVFAYAQNPACNNGAMGKLQGDKIKRLYESAAGTGAPVVAFLDSSGAFADEGLDALNAYGEVINAASALSGVVPQISVVFGGCVGSAALLAGLSDFVILTEKAQYCMTSEFLSGEGVGTAVAAAKSGAAAIVAEDEAGAITAAAKLLSYLPGNNLDVPPAFEYAPAAGTGRTVYAVADEGSFMPLYSECGKCSVTGFAHVGGVPVGLVSVGSDEYGGGRLCESGARKVAGFVRFCDAFSLPVVTLVDCAGFKVTKELELSGGVRIYSALAAAYAEATTAKISVITGRAYGAVYSTFAGKTSNCDIVLALHDSVISALPPETAVQFLWKDRITGDNREQLENEYKAGCSPFAAAEKGLIDDVIAEEDIATRVISALEMLSSKRVSSPDRKHSNIPL